MTKPIFITAATGKTGRRVADRLQAMGVAVTLGSRSGSPPFDWQDEATWHAHLTGVSAAYIAYSPDIAVPGALAHVERFIAIALDKRVKRLVVLSGRGEDEALLAENLLRATAADWTIIRASWFSQNFSEGFFADDIASGTVYFPRDGIVEPFVDVDDIAEIVAASFVDDRHIGQMYEVTGPRLLTFREAFHEISGATGKPIHYVPVEIADYIAALRQAGIPEDYVALIELLTTQVLDGRNSRTSDGIQRALGRPATDFSQFVRKAIASGAWPAR